MGEQVMDVYFTMEKGRILFHEEADSPWATTEMHPPYEVSLGEAACINPKAFAVLVEEEKTRWKKAIGLTVKPR
jgi:hypothetical protein